MNECMCECKHRKSQIYIFTLSQILVSSHVLLFHPIVVRLKYTHVQKSTVIYPENNDLQYFEYLKSLLGTYSHVQSARRIA